MFERIVEFLKSRKLKEEETPPLLVCIHGFGKRRSDEFKNFIEVFSKDYEIIVPNLFDQENKEDTNWEMWVARAEKPVIENPGRDIYLIGYSMGGVIASYIAARHDNVKKLVLLEPAFQWLRPTTLRELAAKSIRKKDFEEYTSIPQEFISTFLNVVANCKKSIKEVKCPTLFIHCIGDKLIPWPVSSKAYNEAKCPRMLLIYGNGGHRVMDDKEIDDNLFWQIKNFFNGNLPLIKES